MLQQRTKIHGKLYWWVWHGGYFHLKLRNYFLELHLSQWATVFLYSNLHRGESDTYSRPHNSPQHHVLFGWTEIVKANEERGKWTSSANRDFSATLHPLFCRHTDSFTIRLSGFLHFFLLFCDSCRHFAALTLCYSQSEIAADFQLAEQFLGWKRWRHFVWHVSDSAGLQESWMGKARERWIKWNKNKVNE